MTDGELKLHVEDARNWEPGIDESRVGVSVDERVVTLHGAIGSYAPEIDG